MGDRLSDPLELLVEPADLHQQRQLAIGAEIEALEKAEAEGVIAREIIHALLLEHQQAVEALRQAEPMFARQAEGHEVETVESIAEDGTTLSKLQQAFVDNHGTISHHHGVGLEHAPWLAALRLIIQLDRTCADVMFSGHTVNMTLAMMHIIHYTDRKSVV